MTEYPEQTAFRLFTQLQGVRLQPCNGLVVRWLSTALKKRAMRRYSRAISRSIEGDDRTLTFASHAADLSRSLKEDYPYIEVAAFAHRMQEEIRRGRRDSERNTSDFISIRTTLELLQTVAFPRPDACKANTLTEYNETGFSLRHLCVKTLALCFRHRCTADCFTQSKLQEDMLVNLIRCIDTLVHKTVCDWSLVEQEFTRLQNDITVHKSTLPQVQVPERWASMAKECRAHGSELRKLQDFYPMHV
ncbi:hypothetical protein MSAN_00845600 [Mycena sanguinolenta]|uniref:Uncharacterized protein n=1 Tax=Mycena sanguinolenta TaxID=230812 RepID=A0A8H7DD76_9AGAR|nr:hypothetical protein MSAN_00845600 [Mycena sanguinolenta]